MHIRYYDAMTNDRPYRKALSEEIVLKKFARTLGYSLIILQNYLLKRYRVSLGVIDPVVMNVGGY